MNCSSLLQWIRLWRIMAMILAMMVISLWTNATALSASQRFGTVNAGVKIIRDFWVEQNPGSTDVRIKGDGLTFTSAKQPSPPAIILYFPNTELQSGRQAVFPENGSVVSVKASQPVGDQKTTRMEITLNQDVPYNIFRDQLGIKLSFAANAAGRSSSSDLQIQKASAVSDQSGLTASRGMQLSATPPVAPATRIDSVYAAKFENGLKVFVGANGTIKNYKAFTIQSPPRIIFDIFNISSPYKNEKLVPVNSKWIKRIRYYGYPDRLRLVLDTDRNWLTSYSAYPVDNGLLIQVGTDAVMAKRGLAGGSKSAAMAQGGMHSAKTIQSIYATQVSDGVQITIRGDGAITKYQTSTTEDPPSIVFDIFDVQSPYRSEQSFPVDTQWVKQVRHVNLGDRVRVFIDTKKPYLSTFTAYPDTNGLVVHVGGPPAQPVNAPVVAATPKQGTQNVSSESSSGIRTGGKPAWVNRIDFVSEDAGKSTLILGTTREVAYDIEKTDENTIRVKLFNARIPGYKQRPLITDRFESAVDNISPYHRRDDRNTAMFDIKLREAVPYFVDQSDNMLMVHFEASSIAPQGVVVATATGETEETLAPPAVESTPPAGSGFESLPVAPPPESELPKVAPSAPATAYHAAATTQQPPEPAVSGGQQEKSAAEIWEETMATDKKVYTGEKIALDFYQTDIKNVFRILREVSGKNFAVDRDVTGEVTLTLDKPVPWDQVLDLILKMNQLGKTMEGDIIRIATLSTLAEEERLKKEKAAEALELARKQKELEPLFTEYIAINYSNAEEEIKPHIMSILTEGRGMVSVDKRTNMIILTDTAKVIRKAKEIVSKLDRVTPQVIIEAKIVEATTTFLKELGTEWGVQGGIQNTAANAGIGPQRAYDLLGGTYGYNTAVNMPTSTDATSSIGFNFLRISGTPFLLSAKLSALESEGSVKIVSAPKVVTLDNKKATIKQGISYPYSRWTLQGYVTYFKDIDLLLEVTPHVTPDNRVSMVLKVTKNDLGPVVNFEQSFTNKEAETELLVNDGDTVVIGGIIKQTENQSERTVPGVSKIPLLGWLFKNEKKNREREELLIFITPKIVKLEQRMAEY